MATATQSRTTATPVPARGDMRGMSLLIVDDDLLQARLLKANLERPGHVQVHIASSANDAMEQLSRLRIDGILTDLAMPDCDGVELVRRVRSAERSLPIIVMTAFATIENAIDGIRAGATEFVQKPVSVEAVLALFERAIREQPLREELTALQQRRAGAAAQSYIAGDHPALDIVRRQVERIASAPFARVLITGESGTGKTLLARAIHDLSGATGRFVSVNCAALPAQLLESELFGHEKGAFTDAKTLKRGLIELSDRGTLFLDEIGAMPLELQSKLLVFLESREIRRVGGIQPIPVWTRVIAATNDDLRVRIRERTFREDLFYRLDVAAVNMPPLRSMPDVIPDLAERFSAEICRELGRPGPSLAPETRAALARHDWPGNARELRNAVERALIFHTGGDLSIEPSAPRIEATASDHAVAMPLGLTLEEVERAYLSATLASGAHDLAETATRLGISRKTLWEKRRRYAL